LQTSKSQNCIVWGSSFWNILDDSIKQEPTLARLKNIIKSLSGDQCTCRVCKQFNYWIMLLVFASFLSFLHTIIVKMSYETYFVCKLVHTSSQLAISIEYEMKWKEIYTQHQNGSGFPDVTKRSWKFRTLLALFTPALI